MTKWLSTQGVTAVHYELIVEHGGIHGVRDANLLESALARPRNLEAYGDPDISELAAAYAWGIARNHPFCDGNKRSALAAISVFLDINGIHFSASEEDAVLTMLELAEEKITESDLAEWIRANSRKI